MTVAIRDYSQHPHISSLQRQIDELGTERVDCLVIAHPDGSMIQQLVKSTEEPIIAVLPLNQVEWGSELREVFGWAASQCIPHVIVAAHSKTVQPLTPPQIFRNGEVQLEPAHTTFDRIIAGTGNMEQRMSMAKERFSAEMQRLSESSEFQHTICGDRIKISALFYVAHSRFFLEFDFNTRTYCSYL